MRTNISSGAPWEDQIGYSRAVRIGNTIEISGTAPVRDGKTAGSNAYEQTIVCLEIIKETLEKAGSSMEDIVRTRMYVTDISQWVAIGKAHHEFFSEVKPATTMVEIKALIDADMLIEIEATAVLSE